MNAGLVARLLARFSLFFAAACLPAFGLSLFETGDAAIDARLGFAVLLGLGLVIGLGLGLSGRSSNSALFRRESLLVVGLAWGVASVLGAIPFWVSDAMPSFVDGFFECVSGLTTTGASVLGAPGTRSVHELPDSLLLWRAELQWIGGLGIILMFAVLLPVLGISPGSLIESEQVGVSDPRVRPRMVQRGRALLRTYLALTFAAAALLWSVGGLSIFEALCHALTTLPTGGFSTRDYSIAEFRSPVVEAILIVFMIVAASSHLLIRDLIVGDREHRREAIRNPELRLFLAILAGCVLVSTVVLWSWGGKVADPVTNGVRDYSSPMTAFRDAAFNIVSVMSGTGFATANFQCWPGTLVLLFLVLMLIGGCTGSTAGGLKVYRLLVVVRVVLQRLQAFVRPRSVAVVRVQGEVLAPREIDGILAIVLLFVVANVIGALLLALDPRIDVLSACSAAITAIGCVGPGLTAVLPTETGFVVANASGIDVGPMGSFGALSAWAKVCLSLLMILGRLEFLALLVLVMPSFWRRR